MSDQMLYFSTDDAACQCLVARDYYLACAMVDVLSLH